MKVQKIDHVGIVVDDLAAAKAFFLELGLEAQGGGNLQDKAVGQIVGLDDVNVEFMYMSVPGGQGSLELIKFHAPLEERDTEKPFSNTLGIRHIAFVVEEIEAVVAKLEKRGAKLVGSVQHLGGYKLCYIRGPEEIILELAEPIN
jgi:catechol 2,3-dioxygenase-like lactoylglutathione lyase family enzyme